MKILEINKYYYLRGGSERYFFDVIDLLNAHGHVAMPFSMQGPLNAPSTYADYFVSEVRLDRFDLSNIMKIFRNQEAARNLEKLIVREKPDIAHLHNIAHQLSPAIITVLKKHHIPVVQTLHDYKLICPNYRLFTENKVCFRCQGGNYYNCLIHKCNQDSVLKSFIAMLEAYYHRHQKTYEQVDLFLAPSQYMKDICVKFGIKRERIKVLPNFISVSDESGGYETENYILYFGRLSPEKGVDVLLSAMDQINSEVRLKVAGTGPDMDKYRTLISDNRLNDKVEMLGYKQGEELHALIKKAKAVVMPSIWPENLPYSALEAMAFGKVVIASQVGGFPELVENNKTGLLFPVGDSKKLAEKIDNLSELDLRAMGEEARQKAGKFNPDSHYNHLISIFNQLVPRSK